MQFKNVIRATAVALAISLVTACSFFSDSEQPVEENTHLGNQTSESITPTQREGECCGSVRYADPRRSLHGTGDRPY